MRLDASAVRRASHHLGRVDPVMARLVADVGPCRLRPRRDGTSFAYLARAIVAQQISVAAARSIAGRLAVRFGTPLPPAEILAASEAELRSVGLSRQKATYLQDLARRTLDGLPLARLAWLSDEEVVATLTVVKGIGRWTAEMYLMFRLGRPDVLPVDDLGLRSAMRRAYRMRRLPTPARMRQVAAAWRPHRTVACWYLWQSLDMRAPA